MKLVIFFIVGVWSAGPRKTRPGIEEVSWRLRQQAMEHTLGDTKYTFRGYENERCSSSSRSRSPECVRSADLSQMSQKDIAKMVLRQGTNRYKPNAEVAVELKKMIVKAGYGDKSSGALANTVSRARKELSEETGEDWSAPRIQQALRIQNGSVGDANIAHMAKSEIAMALLQRDNNRYKRNVDLLAPFKVMLAQRGETEVDDQTLLVTLSSARYFLGRLTNEDWSVPTGTKRT